MVLRACRPGDMLVVGSQGHRPVARMLLGSTSTALVTHATCPVVVVKGAAARPGGPVLVGIDGSATSADAVLLAAEEADRRGVPLRAVIAVPPVVDAMGFVYGPDEAMLAEAQVLLGGCYAPGPARTGPVPSGHPDAPATLGPGHDEVPRASTV